MQRHACGARVLREFPRELPFQACALIYCCSLFNVEASTKIKKLEEAGRQLHSLLRMMVQHNYREEFARTNSGGDDAPGDAADGGGGRGRRSHDGGDGGAAVHPKKTSGGFSAQQLKELGELFGIRNKDEEQQNRKRVYGHEDERKDDGGDRDLSPPAGSASLLDEDSDDGMHRRSIRPGTTRATQRSSIPASDAHRTQTPVLELSLVRQLKSAKQVSSSRLLHKQKTSTTPAPNHVCRMPFDGSLVATAALGEKLVTIWATTSSASRSAEEEPSPISTIRLLAPLTTIEWIASGSRDQVEWRFVFCDPCFASLVCGVFSLLRRV